MPKPLLKLSEILGEIEANKMLTKVSTYEGWHEEFTAAPHSKLKGDSNTTTRIKKEYKALSNSTESNFDANSTDELNKYLHRLKEVRELTKKWLENKMDHHNESDLKKHSKFIPMLALDTHLEEQIKKLTPADKSGL